MTQPEKQSRLERRIEKRAQREEVIARQREAFRQRQRNKTIFNYTILGVVVLAIVYGIYAVTASRSAGAYDSFAQCLSENGAVMYGTDWCPHCQDQKRLFGTSFRYVTYVNCDVDPEACKAAGVEGYPTWVLPKGPPASGTQQLSLLAERTGCALE